MAQDKVETYTVGVITYERPSYVKRLLESLMQGEKLPSEVVIVDDSESDQTAEIVDSLETSFDINYVRRKGKSVQGDARNRVVGESKGDIICFLDDDTEVSKSWLKSIDEIYSSNSEVAGVAGPAIMVDEEGEYVKEIINSSENQNHFNKYGETEDNSDCWIPPEPVETDRFLGANMSFKKEKIEKYGGFSEGYKGNGAREEDEVMARMWKADEEFVYHPEAYVKHFAAPNGGSRAASDVRYWEARNFIRFLRRNFSENYRISLLRILLYTEGSPPPVWKDIGAAILKGDRNRLAKLNGYFDELREI